MQIKASMRYHYTPTKILKLKRDANAKCGYKCEVTETDRVTDEYILGFTILENWWQNILKLTYTYTMTHRNSIPGYITMKKECICPPDNS